MRLDRFPDLRWLRRQARSNFSDRKGWNHQVLPHSGWPNVVLNTTARGVERTQILAPFSLFMNLSGESTVIADSRDLRLGTDTYCLVNRGQQYDLVLPKKQPATTFNVHFGQRLYREVLHALSEPHRRLLEQPGPSREPVFATYTRTRWKKPEILGVVASLRRHYADLEGLRIRDDREYDLLAELMVLILDDLKTDWQGKEALSAQKKSTRLELLRRLFLAADFLHDNYRQQVSLDALAGIACLSKYHFLRCFKEVFGCSPHQYLVHLRLRKGMELLRSSALPVQVISEELGFESAGSFGRLFRQKVGCTPGQFRGEK